MNKKILFLLFIVCISFRSLGQTAPTLTAANFNPNLGDEFMTVVCDTTGVLPGISGANVTWNFATLDSTQTDTGTAVTVASTIAASAILVAQPATNIAVVTPTASMTIYSIKNLGSLSTTGYYQSASQYAVYSDPMAQLVYPVTYSTTFSDTYAGTLYLNMVGYPETGIVYDTCDGWGKLTLPNGISYYPVLRVHSSQIYTDNAGLFGGSTGATFDLESYNWYLPDYHSAVLTVSTVTGTGVAAGYFNKTVSYARKQIAKSGVSVLNNLNASFNLYPNPVTDELHGTFDAGTGGHVYVTMTDVLGRNTYVIADQYAKGIQNISYNTSSLSKGLYLVTLQCGGESVTRKIVLQ